MNQISNKYECSKQQSQLLVDLSLQPQAKLIQPIAIFFSHGSVRRSACQNPLGKKSSWQSRKDRVAVRCFRNLVEWCGGRRLLVVYLKHNWSQLFSVFFMVRNSYHPCMVYLVDFYETYRLIPPYMDAMGNGSVCLEMLKRVPQPFQQGHKDIQVVTFRSSIFL